MYVANLLPFGGRLYKDRPVVVVQNDLGNRSSPETIVLTIRSDHGKRFAILVPVARDAGGLDRNSVIDAGHVLTIPQAGLGRRIGTLPPEAMRAVDEALRTSLAL